MSQDMQSPTYRLADILLNGKLAEYVKGKRASGESWRRIAIDLRDLTDREVDVTHETLRSWFPDDDNGDTEAA